LADQVVAEQGDRQGHLLNGERVGDADLLKGVGDRSQNSEISEGCQGVSPLRVVRTSKDAQELPQSEDGRTGCSSQQGQVGRAVASVRRVEGRPSSPRGRQWIRTLVYRLTSRDIVPGMSDEAGVSSTTPDDPGYRAAVTELLGLLSLAELTAFEHLAADAGLAPSLADKAALAAMAVAEFQHFEQLRDRLAELGVDAEAAMTPFRDALQAFHEHTRPADWLESLVKAYVGDGIAADFYREVAAYVDEDTRALVLDVLADTGHADFVVGRVRAAIDADPQVGGRLALWARRLVGEALSQAQRVAVERDSLSTLIVGGVDRPGMDLAELGQVFARLTENHTKRMSSLGLTA
jgi:hypothetical protein